MSEDRIQRKKENPDPAKEIKVVTPKEREMPSTRNTEVILSAKPNTLEKKK